MTSQYLVYLRRSIQRRFFRHLSLVLILFIAMTMPLMVSIYRSSALEGVRERVWEFTRGSNFIIRNANEGDLPLFSDIPGLAATFEEGSIYLRLLNESETLTREVQEQYSAELLSRMYQSENKALRASNVTFYGDDPSLYHAPNQMYVVSWIISLVALAIFFSSYGNHLRLFRPEIAILRGLGAARGQVLLLFLVEYLVMFLPAGLLALGTAVGIMKLLFVSYLEIRHVEGLASVVFHLNIIEMLHLLAAFFLIGSLFVMAFVWREGRRNIQGTRKKTAPGRRPRGFRWGLKQDAPAEKMLAGMYLHRLSRVAKSCGALAVPVLAIVIFATHYLAINLQAATTPPATDIRINCYDFFEERELLSTQDRQQISQMDSILSYREKTATDPSDFLIADQRIADAPGRLDRMGIPMAGTALHRYSTFHPSPLRTLEKYEVTVTANHAYLAYRPGDTIQLYPGHTPDPEGAAEPISLTVVATEDLEWTDRYVDILLSDVLYEELTAGMPVKQIDIRLRDPGEAKFFAERLAADYPAIRDHIAEFRSAFEVKKRATPGAVIMFAVLFGMMALFVFAVQIIRLSEELMEQESIRHILRVTGASQRMLRTAHLRQSTVIAAITLIFSLILGYGLLLIFFHRTGYHLLFTWETVLVQLLLILLAIAAFYLPLFFLFRSRSFQEVNRG